MASLLLSHYQSRLTIQTVILTAWVLILQYLATATILGVTERTLLCNDYYKPDL